MAEERGKVGVLEPPGAATVSLAERAYRAIREMIVSVELRPGAVIDERRLMEQLGIGRTPTRAALRRRALEQTAPDQREILEAIRGGDADRAEEAMRRHVVEFEEAMRHVLTGA